MAALFIAYEIIKGVEPPHSKIARDALYIWPFPFYFWHVRKCPTCGGAVEWKDNPWRPFCSERCKLIDFGKWASEEYRMPGQEINHVAIPHPTEPDKTDEDRNEN